MGAETVSTPRDVAKTADVIITILPADAELKETIFGSTGILKGLAPGKVLIEMTTGTALAMQEVDAGVRPGCTSARIRYQYGPRRPP